MKLKRFGWIALLCGVVICVAGAWMPFLKIRSMSMVEVGIIGGVSAPTYFTAIRVMYNIPALLFLVGFDCVLISLFSLLFSNTVKKHCSVKSTLLALGLSAAGGIGIYCFLIWFSIVSFNAMKQHPFSYPTSLAFGLISLTVFFLLAMWYTSARKSKKSAFGILLDTLTSILCLPTFICAAMSAEMCLAELVAKL